MKLKYFPGLLPSVLCAGLVIGMVFISGCAQQEAEGNPKIKDIISNPQLYKNKIVIINGKFGGWSGSLPCNYSNLAMKTRSDTLIYDETGCLYMNGEVEVLSQEREIDPTDKNNIGGNLQIKAVVGLIKGKPILIPLKFS